MKKVIFVIIYLILSISTTCYSANDISSVTNEINRSYRKEVLQKQQQHTTSPLSVTDDSIKDKTFDIKEKEFYIKNITLVGAKSFEASEFNHITSKYENKNITLSELRLLAKKIKREYIKKGIIAAVVVPPQEITNESAVLHIIEARMGELTYNKHRFFKNSKIQSYWKLKNKSIIVYPNLSKSLSSYKQKLRQTIKSNSSCR